MLSKEDALKGIRLYVFDMDGTVYLGDQPIEGAFEFVRRIEASEDSDYIFFTNNASRVPEIYVEKLARMGFHTDAGKIITAGDVCAAYLKKEYPGGAVYLNGTKLLEDNWRAKGIRLVEEDPDVAVQSFDTSLTYDKLDRICRYVRNGVPFIATHMDINCPTEDGFMPDCGAMCALITASTGVKPRYFGKPWRETVDMLEEITGIPAKDMAFVGDRLYTDVATGVRNGARGILVLSGESDMETVRTSDVEPTCIYDSLAEMNQYFFS